MAKIKVKGTVLQVEIASVFTAVGQIVSLDLGKKESETSETDTIDDATASIEMSNTGRAKQDDTSCEIFYDPDSAAHQFLTDSIDAPAAFPINGKVILATTDEVTFIAEGFGMGLKFAKGDFVKAPLTIQHAGLCVWPS